MDKLDIDVGEEILVSYIATNDDYYGRDERRRMLFSGWKFVCNCKVCHLDDNDLVLNETVRDNIKKFTHEVATHSFTDIIKALLSAKKKLQMLYLIKDEVVLNVSEKRET
jgi:hypothetical protein